MRHPAAGGAVLSLAGLATRLHSIGLTMLRLLPLFLLALLFTLPARAEVAVGAGGIGAGGSAISKVYGVGSGGIYSSPASVVRGVSGGIENGGGRSLIITGTGELRIASGRSPVSIGLGGIYTGNTSPVRQTTTGGLYTGGSRGTTVAVGSGGISTSPNRR